MLRSILVTGGRRVGRAIPGPVSSLVHPLSAPFTEDDSRVAVGSNVTSRRWLAADAKPAAPAGGGAPKPKGGKGGSQAAPKKKDKGFTAPKQPNSGVKFGHGAKNRPDRTELRQKERQDRFAARAAAALSADGIHTDDEEMQLLYDLVNKKEIDYSHIKEEELAKPLPPPGERGGEELWQRHDTMRAKTFEGAFVVPKELQGKVQVVRDDFDVLAQTDIELSEDEIEAVIKTGEDDSDFDANAEYDPSKSTPRDTIDLVNNYAEAHPEKLQRLMKGGFTAEPRSFDVTGRQIIETLGDLRRRRLGLATEEARPVTAAGVEEEGPRDPRQARQQRRANEAKAAANTLAGLLNDSGDEARPAKARAPAVETQPSGAASVKQAGTDAAAQAVVADDGYESPHSRTFLLDSSDGEVVEYPQLPLPRPSLFRVRGELTHAGEDDALHEEQARQLIENTSAVGKEGAAAAHRSNVQNARAAAAAVSLSGDDSSDWGGDDLDPRYSLDPLVQDRQFRRRYNIGETDSEAEELLELGVDAAGSRINAAFGDGIEKIPDAVLQELASPFDFKEHLEGKPYPDAETVREAEMSPEERVLDEQRKKLRDLIERPLPIVNRPLWPLHAMVAAVDQVQQVVKGGMVASTRCMIVVGNEQGGAGFGIGKHKEPFMATKMALANAQRDMIHISLHKRQLYHDLIGKHNNLYVIMRTMPGTAAFNNAPPMLQDIFDIVGIDNVSAKIVGSRRREAYQVVQALFDGFHHHRPPENEAFARGLRMQWMGADRHNPRNVYPFAPRGPRYPSASERWVKGKARA